MTALLLLLCSDVFALGPAWYYDIEGDIGLTIVAYRHNQCTGDPLGGVTVNIGQTGLQFNDLGGGMYWRLLAENDYYIFDGGTLVDDVHIASDSSLALIAGIAANNWVTLSRMADGSVSSAEVVDNSLTASDLGSGSVTGSELADAQIFWRKLSASLGGASPDTLYDLDEMQTDLTDFLRTWSTADFDAVEMDSILNVLIGTSFSSAACTLQIAPRSEGVRIEITMNTEANYDAVARYEIYADDVGINIAGSVDDTEYGNLQASMDLRAIIPSPGRGMRNYFVHEFGQVCILAVAIDYAGNRVASFTKCASSTDMPVGEANDLSGTPGYVEGQNIAQALSNALTTVAALQNTVAGLFTAINSIYSDHSVSDSTVGGSAANLTTYYSSETGTPVKVRLQQSVYKPAGANTLVLTGQVRCKSVGEEGRIWLKCAGQTVTYPFGKTSTGADTTWTEFFLPMSLGHITDNTSALAQVQGSATLAGDSLMMRYLDVKVQH